jgi:hypothetical protein
MLVMQNNVFIMYEPFQVKPEKKRKKEKVKEKEKNSKIP